MGSSKEVECTCTRVSMGRSNWLAELIAGQKSIQARKGQSKYCDRRDNFLD